MQVGEGRQLPVDQIPVSGRSAEAWRDDLLLPAGVGQWIGHALDPDQAFRHLDGRDPSVEMVEPAQDHGWFDSTGLDAEALMIPVLLFLAHAGMNCHKECSATVPR